MEQTYQNLIDLRGVAERGPEYRNMTTWGWRTDHCGTVHCWAGQYAVDHPGRGVRLVPYSLGKCDQMKAEGCADPYDGLAVHFGISRHESLWLFEPGHYDDAWSAPRHEMLLRVDELLAKYSPAPVLFQGIKTEGDGPAGTYRPECGESAYAMAAVKVSEGVEVGL